MDKDKSKIFVKSLEFAILILIEKGVKFICSRPKKKFEFLPELFYELKGVRREVISDEIMRLYANRIIRRDKKTGQFILTKRGKKLLEKYRFDMLKSEVNKHKFNGKWLIVFFDIPENKRRLRDLLRVRLKHIGFYEIQKSVFVYPGLCKNEIEFLLEYFDLKRYVRYAVCDEIDNQMHLKQIFNIL